jgi:D-aminopeptidase
VTPVLLTTTLSVGQVGDCDDSWLNDSAGRHIAPENVFEAIETASDGPVAEGSVGGGTGMICCDFKAGIGTSSRKLAPALGGYTIGILVMNNFGHMRDLRIAGFPVGPLLEDRYRDVPKRSTSYGSIIAVAATDAPLSSHQLGRVSKRVALGIGRAGSMAAHGSGEIILAFSTANKVPRTTPKMIHHMKILLDKHLNPIYEAAIEATEEAILNSMCMARDMVGANNNFAPALPLDEVKELLDRWKLRPKPAKPPVQPPAPVVPVGEQHEPTDEPTIAEAIPSSVRGAEGMMTIPLQPSKEPLEGGGSD